MTTGLGFWAYELGNAAWRQRTGRAPKPSERGIVGGLTACFVMTVTLPLLVVSRRLQVPWLCLSSVTIGCFGKSLIDS